VRLYASGKVARHHALNDVLVRAFSSAGIPVANEPEHLFRTNGKRPASHSILSRTLKLYPHHKLGREHTPSFM